MALAVGIFALLALRAATDNQLAVNGGLALSGFDPVAYFTEGKRIWPAGDRIELGRRGLARQQ